MSFKAEVVEYLSVHGHPERQTMLNHLRNDGAFWYGSETVQRNVVKAYVAENPHGFCNAGINRFKARFNLDAPGVRQQHALTVLIESEDANGSVASTVNDALSQALVGQVLPNGGLVTRVIAVRG